MGGYVNYPNAQNINCDNIAKCLDKDKFEVHTMFTSKKPIDKQAYEMRGIRLHKLIHHRFVWYWNKIWIMLIGNYDIYYLPKMEPMDRIFAKWKKGKGSVFISSIEGVITEKTNNSDSYRWYHIELMDATFAISKCIADSVKKFWDKDLPVLPLGTVEPSYKCKAKQSIKSIIWVGNVKANKRPQFFIECAKRFPQIDFVMVGDGDMLENLQKECLNERIDNVLFTGRIANEKVYEYMGKCDLLLMTSEYEGLPKVIQEAAQCYLPSIYINENYSVDFVVDGENGFAVSTVEKMFEKIRYLLDNPMEFRKMSKKAYHNIQKYTWSNLIKKYEYFFIEEYEKHSKTQSGGC